ncbi:MAG TPA: helix-turn-helix transcriptional regulator [Arachidicoccus sp.]|nr:helix-turn-helix transcriptional regulator [Arachidicoccus sp.]
MKAKDLSFHQAFGKHLLELIKERKLTPETVAARGEIETKAVYRVINAEHSPTLSILKAIAKGIDMKLAELLDFKYGEL